MARQALTVSFCLCLLAWHAAGGQLGAQLHKGHKNHQRHDKKFDVNKFSSRADCSGKITKIACQEDSKGLVVDIAYYNDVTGYHTKGCWPNRDHPMHAAKDTKQLVLAPHESIVSVKACTGDQSTTGYALVTVATDLGQRLVCGSAMYNNLVKSSNRRSTPSQNRTAPSPLQQPHYYSSNQQLDQNTQHNKDGEHDKKQRRQDKHETPKENQGSRLSKVASDDRLADPAPGEQGLPDRRLLNNANIIRYTKFHDEDHKEQGPQIQCRSYLAPEKAHSKDNNQAKDPQVVHHVPYVSSKSLLKPLAGIQKRSYAEPRQAASPLSSFKLTCNPYNYVSDITGLCWSQEYNASTVCLRTRFDVVLDSVDSFGQPVSCPKQPNETSDYHANLETLSENLQAASNGIIQEIKWAEYKPEWCKQVQHAYPAHHKAPQPDKTRKSVSQVGCFVPGHGFGNEDVHNYLQAVAADGHLGSVTFQLNDMALSVLMDTGFTRVNYLIGGI